MEERSGRNYIYHIGRATHYIYLLDCEKDLFEQYYGVVLQPSEKFRPVEHALKVIKHILDATKNGTEESYR